MLKTKEQILSLIGSGVFSTPLSKDFPKTLSLEEAEMLFEVSKSHDLAQVAAVALKNHRIRVPAEVDAKFQKQLFFAVFRCEKLEYEFKRISDALERGQIPFIPLKGSVLRPYYPESWLRTSCDIDLLVHVEDLERAGTVLTETVGYEAKGQWNGERSYFSPDGIHLELHFYDEADDGEGAVFQQIWDHVSPAEGCRFRMETEWEFFFVHHVMHMAKHFSHGGCGIRPFIDLAVMRKKIPMNSEKKREYLKAFSLSTFAEHAELLSRVWFENEVHSPLTLQMQEYLFGAGVYGSISNQVALEKSGHSKGSVGFFGHLWLPFDVIKHQYPVMIRHKWLYPFCQVRRWCKLVFCGGLKRSLHRLRENQTISNEKVESIARLMNQLELS